MSLEKVQRLKDSVKWYSVSEELLPRDGLVLVAVSGGPDSMALLSILHGLTGELHFRVAAAYFDHQIRDHGAEERDFVARFTRSLSVPFYSGADDVPSLAESCGDTIEEAARKARYRFLHRLADTIRADRIATGHTRSDQVETILMRVLRGTGIRGLTGIPVRRGKVVRPLLCAERSDTLLYCESMGFASLADVTNEDRRHFRNRVRHELLPLLKASYHPAVEENLLRLATNAGDMIGTVRATTDPLIRKNLRKISAGEWTLNISRVATLDETSIFVLFGDVFTGPLSCDMDFSRVHFEKLVRLVKDSGASGKKLDLPGLTVKREYEHFILTKTRARGTAVPSWDYHRTTLTLPGETAAAGVIVKTEILDRSMLNHNTVKATDRTAYFAMESLRPPLVLRNPRQGDRMKPFGMRGQKKLSDIFVDRKIPGRMRPKSLIVADCDDILWLVGVTTSEKSRVHDQTGKVIKITVEDQPRREITP